MRRHVLIAAIVLTLGSADLPGAESPVEPANAPPAWTREIESSDPGAWEWLRTFNDGTAAWLFTRQNVRHRGTVLSVWRRIEFRDPQPGATFSPLWTGTYLSLVEQVDVNCVNPSELLRAISRFRRRNMTDPILPSLVFDPGQSSWQPAIPGTRVAVFVNHVCALFAVHRMQPL